MDHSPPGSSVQYISQESLLEWVAVSFSRESFQSRKQTLISCTGRWIIYQGGIKGATREAQEYWCGYLPDAEIEPGSLALQVDSLPAELPGKPFIQYMSFYSLLISQNMETYPYWCKQLHLLYLIYNILHMSMSMGSQSQTRLSDWTEPILLGI